MPTWDTPGTHQHDISSGADALLVTLQGAAGAPGQSGDGLGAAGQGGELTVRIPTSALPSTVEVVVGAQATGQSGGSNGGGDGTDDFYGGSVSGGGGGASDIRDVDGGYGSRYAAAGAGAGGSADSAGSSAGDGGDGGYPTGENGTEDFFDGTHAWPHSYGEGGQQDRGGYGGTTESDLDKTGGNDGSLGAGGNGVSEGVGGGEDEGTASGGAGAGWYGGGSGGATQYSSGGSGGGSSGAQNDSWVESHATGVVAGDGSVTITELTVTASGLTVPYVGANEVDLDWDGSNADEFEIERDGEVIGTTASTAFTDDGVAENTEHAYQVFAVYAGTREASTDSVSVTTGGPPTTTGITEGDRAFTLTAGGLTGDWTELRIYRNSPEHDGEIAYSGAPDVTVTDSGLLDGLDYTFEFVGVYPRGESSAAIETGSLPLPPLTDFEVVDVRDGEADVRVQDNANHKDGYRFWRGDEDDGYLEFYTQETRVETGLNPSDHGMTGDTPKTLIVTVQINEETGTSRGIWQFGNQGASGEEFSLRKNNYEGSTYGFRAQFWGGDLDFWGGSSGSKITIALAYEDGLSEAYIDGESRGTFSRTLNTQDGAGLQLGRWADEIFSGNIYSMKAYNRRLSDAEIVADAAGDIHYDGLVAYYPIAFGSTTTVADYSGHGHDGTIVNNHAWGGDPMVQDGGDLAPQYGVNLGREYINPPDSPHLQKEGGTLLIDFQLDSVKSGVVGNPSTNDNMIEVNEENHINAETAANGNFFEPDGAPELPAGKRHWLAVRFDDFEADWWINGDYHTVSDYGTNYVTNEPRTELDGDLEIGAFGRAAYENPIDGTFGRATLYERPLTDAEIFEWSRGGIPSDPHRHYPFNDGPGFSSTEEAVTGTMVDLPSSYEWVSPPYPITHTLTDLSNGEAYVTRSSIFTEHTEVFDR